VIPNFFSVAVQQNLCQKRNGYVINFYHWFVEIKGAMVMSFDVLGIAARSLTDIPATGKLIEIGGK
jgi:hypothetical protein